MANIVDGTAGSEYLQGTNGDDSIRGFAGDDFLYDDAGGNDTLEGGEGNDAFKDNLGNNVLNGGNGIDEVDYYQATAGLTINLSKQQATDGTRTDTLISIERVHGTLYADTFIGDAGNNYFNGADGADTVDGGLGDDTLYGGNNVSTVSYASAGGAVTVSLYSNTASGAAGNDQLLCFSTVIGSDYSDTLISDYYFTLLSGGKGDDTLSAGAASVFSSGENKLDGGEGWDTASFAKLHYGLTINLSLEGVVQDVTGYDDPFTLVSIEHLEGGYFDDTLTGDAGGNSLDGGLGDDTLTGGSGNDVLIGAAGTDYARFSDMRANYTITPIGDGTAMIEHLGGAGADGMDRVISVEKLQFADVTLDTPCFLRGTHVLTRSGYRAVEELTAGDELLTLQHGWQELLWIGHKRLPRVFSGRAQDTVTPIRIRAGAFGPELPRRDLWVSPDHAVFFRDHLIPAHHLVNGGSVQCDRDIEDIEYFHLLLGRHAVIFSEGLPTESYSPQENIHLFANADTLPLAVQQAMLLGVAPCLRDCLPRLTHGPVVETARAHLARRMPADTACQAVG